MTHPLETEIDDPVFCLTWHDSRRFLQIMEIYAPNEEQCFRLLEIMRLYAKSQNWTTDSVLVAKTTMPANEGWRYLVVKFPEHKTKQLEQAFQIAKWARKAYARAMGEKDPRQ